MSEPATHPRIPQVHRLILVRHARSRPDPASPPASWALSVEGQAAARRLAALGLFDHAAGYYAGPEPKLVETLRPVAAGHGQDVQPEPGFAETRSAGWLGEEAFREAVRRLFATPDEAPLPGWETLAAARSRCAEAVDRLRARHGPVVLPGHALPGTFAIASGGRLLAGYLAHVLGYDPQTTLDLWRGLRMPDLCVLDLPAAAPARLVIPFGALAV